MLAPAQAVLLSRLAHELRGSEVYGIDLSADALEIARANAARLQLDGRVKFVQGDILRVKNKAGSSARAQALGRNDDVLGGAGEFQELDFVVSNPPYVGMNEADKVQRSVREFEPAMAVFSGENGLDVIRPLIDQAHAALKAGGWLAMEIGYSMRDVVLELLSPTMWEDIRVVPDLQGIPRVIAARKR